MQSVAMYTEGGGACLGVFPAADRSPLCLPSFPRKRESRNSLVKERQPAVSIPASRRNGRLYIGVYSDLGKRV